MLISSAVVLQAAFLVAVLIKMANYNPHSQNDEGAVSTPATRGDIKHRPKSNAAGRCSPRKKTSTYPPKLAWRLPS